MSDYTLTIPLALSGLGYVLGIFGLWKTVGKNVGHASSVLIFGLEKTIENITPEKLGPLDLSDLKEGEINAFNTLDQFLGSDSGQMLLKTHINRYFAALPPVRDILDSAETELGKELNAKPTGK